MAAKKCLICNSAFAGRADAKTCSPRCRKRLQQVRFLLSSSKRGRLVKAATILVFGLFGALSILLSAAPQSAHAATSSNLNFQARLLNSAGGVVPDGIYNIDFKIYNANGTTGTVGTCSSACLWEETRKVSNSQGVTVVNGYFSVNLGSVTSFPTINWDQQLWLTMNIGGTANTASPTWDGEMQNAGNSIALTALPYSFVAGQLALTSGANRGVLGFSSVTNNPVVTLPNETGTVCTTASNGICTLAGTGFVQLQSATPGTAQTGNFNITGTGAADVLIAASGVITGTVSTSAGDLALIPDTGTVVIGQGHDDVNVLTSCSGVTFTCGSITIDSGTSASVGDINIGTLTNASINLGNGSGTLIIANYTSAATIDVGGSLATLKGTDYATLSGNDVNFGDVSLVRLTGSSTQTITGIANGRDGYHLTLLNAASQAAVIANQSGSSVAINRITTGTGGNFSLAPGAAIELVYDSTSSLWRVASSGTGVTTVGTYSSSNHYADGASISGNSLTLGSADATHPGLVDVSAQTFAGNKTLTGNTVLNGTVLAENTSDSAAAFQVQNSAAAALWNVNTLDGYVIDNGISAVGNIIENPSFEASGTTTTTGWYTPSASQVITTSAANANSGNRELQITGNSSTHAVTTKYFAVHPGDTIYTEVYVKNSAGANGDAGMYLEFSDKDKGNATFSNNDTGLPGTSYVLKSITTTVPASKFFVRLALSVKATASTGTFYFDDVYLKKANEQAPLLITNATATAFQVQNASAQTVLGVDSANNKIFTTIPDSGSAIGFLLNTPSYTTSGAKLLSVQNNNVAKFTVDKDGNVTTTGALAIAGAISGATTITGSGNFNSTGGSLQTNSVTRVDNSGNLVGIGNFTATAGSTFSTTGANGFTFKAGTDNTTTFQVQNATSSKAVLTIDTSGNKTILGTGGASGITGTAQFNYSGSTGSITIAPLDPTSTAYTLNLPAENGTFCTSAAASTSTCTNFASASSLTAGLATKLNKNAADTSAAAVTVGNNLYAFTNNSSAVASGVLKLDNNDNTDNVLYVTGSTDYASGKAYIVVNNTNGTPSGNLIDLQANASSKFSVDASGNILASGNISIATGKTYQINGVQITSAALSNNSDLAKLASNQTFTAINTFSNASNSFTGDGANLSNLNAANISSGLLNNTRLNTNVALTDRQNQTFDGYNTFAPTANNVGTIIKQTSGTATSGSVLDVQTANGTSHFLQITNAAANEGNVTLQSVGATRSLTLDSGSGIIKLGSNTTILQKAAAAFTIDLSFAGTSALTLANSNGTNVTSLVVTGDIVVTSGQVYKVGGTSGNTISTCGAGSYVASFASTGGLVTGGACTALGANGDSITVNSSAATDANFLDVASAAAVTGTAWSLAGASPSNITVAVANATNTTAGAVTANAQTFGGDKTFTGATLVKKGSTTAFQVQDAATSTTVFGIDTTNTKIFTNTADGSGAIGFAFNTPSYTTAGAKLLNVQNNGSEKFSVDKDGNVNIAIGATYKINGGDINTNGVLSNVAYLSQTQTLSGVNTFSNATININSSTVATSQGTITFFNTNATNVTEYGAATTISVGATTGTITFKNANQTFGNAAGSGVLTNNGATLNSTLALSNFNYTGSGNTGSIGSAASTVDIYTSISVAQTQAPTQTLTIPTPAASTAYGRLLYLSNIGTAAFIVSGVSINPGQAGTLVWSNTNGAASWQFAGAGADSIANQSTLDQTANFRISGTGRANTSFTAPLIDSITGSLSVGTATATSVLIGGTTNTTGITLQGAAGAAVNIGNAAGSGVLVNNGATLNTTLALGNLAAGSIGSAASTVDIYTSFSIAPAASNRAYTVPTPTASTLYGRTIHIGNIAAAGNYFTISGIRIPPGSTGTLIWSNTNGGASWQFAGAGGASIENQNSSDQVADFRISGSGQASTSFLTPLLDTAAAGTLGIGTTTATAITLGTNTTVTAGKLLVIGTNSSDLTCTSGGIYYNTTNNRFKGCENGTWVFLDNYSDVQHFTSSGTWTKPANVNAVQVIVIGGGGGGGGGGARNGGQERNGGGGGGAGAYASQVFSASDLASASVTIGAAGSSGAGAPSSASAGSNGGVGGTTCLSSTSSCGGTMYVEAFGGGGGGGGNQAGTAGGGGGGGGGAGAAGSTGVNTSNTGASGGGPAGGAANASVAGGAGAGGGSANSGVGTAGNAGGAAEYGGGGGGGAAGGNAASGNGGSSMHGGGGGGAGGSTNSGNATGTGGVGGTSQSITNGGGGAAGTAGAACTAGNGNGANGGSGTSIKAGSGGGGGGANGGGGGTGCPGGNGGQAGGGGGGGGSGSASAGAGGTGGAGEVWVISW